MLKFPEYPIKLEQICEGVSSSWMEKGANSWLGFVHFTSNTQTSNDGKEKKKTGTHCNINTDIKDNSTDISKMNVKDVLTEGEAFEVEDNEKLFNNGNIGRKTLFERIYGLFY